MVARVGFEPTPRPSFMEVTLQITTLAGEQEKSVLRALPLSYLAMVVQFRPVHGRIYL